MAKTPPDSPITEADLKTYLKTRADFAFEMRVLKTLRDLGFECEHGGAYRDPITERVRQFDIRARRKQGPFYLWLAVECKNIQAGKPLLVHAVARRETEAYHELVLRREVPEAGVRVRTISRYESAYPPGDFVGKATDQVRRQDGGFQSSDQEVFERMNQAVNSAHDLISEAGRIEPAEARAIVPLVVVPDGTLWQVEYTDDGAVHDGPKHVSATTLFLDHTWTVQSISNVSYSMSHLELVVNNGLHARTEYLVGPRGVFAQGQALFRNPQ